MEAQFAFVTENRALQAALHSVCFLNISFNFSSYLSSLGSSIVFLVQEVEGLWAHAVPVNERTFAEKQRIVKTWEQIATHMISSFL